MKPFFGVVFVGFIFAAGLALGNGPRCAFDEVKLEFEGTPLEQARCLLRPVKQGGKLDPQLKELPKTLEQFIGKPVAISRDKLQKYLQAKQIKEEDVGGAVTNTVSAKYFVIHDVSAPNYHEKPFPSDINEATWSVNNLDRWRKTPVAHMFVNRLGQSATSHTFNTPWRATKFETKVLGEKSRGLFVHIELVQPRRADPSGAKGNDAIAPEPGFTVPQLDRLALLYLIASVEHGTWLVPGYHACVDANIPNAHDDPQHFDLPLWANRLHLLLQEIAK